MKRCAVDGCERDAFCKGFCTMHYQRHFKTGDAGPAEKLDRHGAGNSNWRGGIARAGQDGRYRALYLPDHPGANALGYVLEHRVVMERHLGRYLTADEIVHHLNEDPADNRTENLEVMGKPEHTAMHSREYWDARRTEAVA